MVERRAESTARPEQQFPIKALEAYLKSQFTVIHRKAQAMMNGQQLTVAIPSPAQLGFTGHGAWLPMQQDAIRTALAKHFTGGDDAMVSIVTMSDDDWAVHLLRQGERDEPQAPSADDDTGLHAVRQDTDPAQIALPKEEEQAKPDAAESAKYMLDRILHPHRYGADGKKKRP
jgi:hypothetical protein